ncbi:gins1 [Symbiodinium necroappetens]|uniref:Gins1 protein n=1 Tax=Symbiodinium necroappetens TaxID=1628268 RepID=A0A812YLG6_9DINO|nr:gins1 [Symbiodinium necroappetens]|mmetsp:Transcript_55366/g.132246  ORF Transcript_55366/g.132246 Transcript_55366/m.132246 type:complete len:217 (+) Transcript_55366:39-689(+)
MPAPTLHGHTAIGLLQDLKRSRWLPQFNEKDVKKVIEEIRQDNAEMKRMARESDDQNENEVLSGMYLYDELMHRNKRMVLCYLNYRAETIEKLRWQVGLMMPPDKLGKLHEAEKQYLKNYINSLDKYMKRYTPDCKLPLDLTADAGQAPNDGLHVKVRVLKADPTMEGIQSLESGPLRFRPGTQMLVKRSDVEHLIRAGKVMQVRSYKSDTVGGGF